jgi:hypothetical protein
MYVQEESDSFGHTIIYTFFKVLLYKVIRTIYYMIFVTLFAQVMSYKRRIILIVLCEEVMYRCTDYTQSSGSI